MLDPLHTLALARTPGIGPATVRAAIKASTQESPVLGAEGLLDLLKALQAKAPRTRVAEPETLAAQVEAARVSLLEAERMGVSALVLGSEGYPPALSRIDDPPPLLFLRGDPDAAASPSVAVVGTRTPTEHGRRASRRLGVLLAEAGFVVVSGLAAGCDAEAHLGCLDAGGRTVAVLAHGLDRVYPPEHLGLAEEIVSTGGALVSEHAPGTPPRRRSFVDRNRIQTGLSLGTVVVETALKGGTMHTARFATSQGRPLACVAHPSGPRSTPEGNVALIDAGDAAALDSRASLDAFLGGLSQRGVEPPARSADTSRPQGELFT